jgi:hypothetical protein
MDLAEWSGIGFSGVIYFGISAMVFGYLNLRRTIVKNSASAANRIDGAPSERERLGGTGLLTHDVGKKGDAVGETVVTLGEFALTGVRGFEGDPSELSEETEQERCL